MLAAAPGSIPKEWDGLSSLIDLNLSHNRISGAMPHSPSPPPTALTHRVVALLQA